MSGLRRPRVDPLLCLVVLLGFASAVWFALRCKQYFIQPDELEYVRQSLRIGDRLFPLLPGVREFASYSQLQPLIMAPAWGLFGTNTAHQVQQVINALVMASTAIPVHLLAVRVLRDRRAALLVALISVAIPWMAASATMMTEVAAYPAFAWGLLGVHRAVAVPTRRTIAWAIAGVLLAFFARPQFALLGVVLVVGLVVTELRFAADPAGAVRVRAQRLRDALWRNRILVAVIVLGGLVAVTTGATHRIFGGYDVTTKGSLLSSGALSSGREVLAYIGFGVGILPVAAAAAWLLGELWSPSSREAHAFAVTALATIVVLTIAVGSFIGRFTPQGINSRYLFYLAPILLIAAAACLLSPRPRSPAIAFGGLLAFGLIHGAALAQTGPSLVSPDSVFHGEIYRRLTEFEARHSLGPWQPQHVLAALGLAGALALAGLRLTRFSRRANIVAAVFVAGFCLVETGTAYEKLADTQKGASQAFLDGRDWIDRALPDGARARVLISSLGDPAAAPAVWWDVSFWNKKVRDTLVQPGPIDFQQPFPVIVSVNSSRGVLTNFDPNGVERPLRLSYLVRAANDRTFGLRHVRVLGEQYGVQLQRVDGPPDVAWVLHATDDSGRLQLGVPATMRIFNPTPTVARTLKVRIKLTTSDTATRGYGYEVAGARGLHARQRVIAKGAQRTITVVARAGAGTNPPPYADVVLLALGHPLVANPKAGLQITGVRVLS